MCLKNTRDFELEYRAFVNTKYYGKLLLKLLFNYHPNLREKMMNWYRFFFINFDDFYSISIKHYTIWNTSPLNIYIKKVPKSEKDPKKRKDPKWCVKDLF